ncbi:glycoside hydrolase family 3 protein [Pyronema omphalodes]|nr:glycoside hydrolase family 3 protein [Pyronema omphalodes]
MVSIIPGDKRWQESYKKAAEIVGRMSLAEKINITTGTGWQMGPCVGNTGSAESVGFGGLCLQDGPLGVRFADSVTVFPAGITVAATWDRRLMFLRGKALGAEMKGKGVNVMLGPAMMGNRMPAGGRNWEGFGADPVLSGIAVAETVKGIQGEGVIACAKHYIGNEQEIFRQAVEARGQNWLVDEAISANIGGRALREIYAWPFMDAVESGVGSVMCSYNQINNSYACQNSYLLNGLLKDEMNFQGFVVSDWIAQRSGVASVLAGLDMTMPGDGRVFADGNSYWGSELTTAVLNGSVPLSRVDDMALRIIATWYSMGQDSPSYPRPNFSSWFRLPQGPKYFGSDEAGKKAGITINNYTNVRSNHSSLARQIAAESIVLLKNTNNTLPFGSGTNARKSLMVLGEGAMGNKNGVNSCIDRGCNDGTLGQGWGSGSVEYSTFYSPLEAIQEKAREDGTLVSYVTSEADHNRIYATISSYPNSTCIVFASADSGEGYLSSEGHHGDRNDLKLWHNGDRLIQGVASICQDTVVVIHTVGPVDMESFIDHPNVTAVLLAHLPGQEAGSSLTDILWGAVNPSGRLPYTIARQLPDYGPGGQVMYTPNHPIPQQDFDEGLYTDYRYFDKFKLIPRFDFGFGLSYTNFEFSDLNIQILMKSPPEFLPQRSDTIQPPELNSSIPDPKDLLFPENFVKINKYIYPYLSSAIPSTSPSPSPSIIPASQRLQPNTTALFTPLLTITTKIRNTGKIPGKAVAQLYMSYPNITGLDVDFPIQVLRGFQKVEVQVNQTVEVSFEVTWRDLAFYDEKMERWRLPVKEGKLWGGYGFAVKGSSRGGGTEGTMVWEEVGR